MFDTLGAEVNSVWVCADANGNPYFFCHRNPDFYPLLKQEIRECRRIAGEVHLLSGQDATDAVERVRSFWPPTNPSVGLEGAWLRVSPDYPHN